MLTKANKDKLQEIFFKAPEKKFYLRELERLTGISAPGLMKITKKLEKEEIIESKKEARVKNFYATRTDKFISLKRAYNINSLVSSGLVDFLREKYQEPEAIVLFGSYSKGEDISTSDIDIAIISLKDFEPALSKFEKILGRKINIMAINLKKAEPEFINSLANGIVLYGFLKVTK